MLVNWLWALYFSRGPNIAFSPMKSVALPNANAHFVRHPIGKYPARPPTGYTLPLCLRTVALFKQVSTMLTFSGGKKPHGHSILHSAAVSGDVDVFKALLAVPVGAAMGDDIFEAILALPGGKTLKVG